MEINFERCKYKLLSSLKEQYLLEVQNKVVAYDHPDDFELTYESKAFKIRTKLRV